MSAAASSSTLRLTHSVKLKAWKDPYEQDTLGLTTLFLQTKEEFLDHTLLQMQRFAAEKNFNLHLIGEGDESSYHITPAHIWKQIKGTEEKGKFKKKKNAEDFSKTTVARLVIEKRKDVPCPIAEYEIQKLFAGKRGIVTVYDLLESTTSKRKKVYTLYAENYNLGDLCTCEEILYEPDAQTLRGIAEDLIVGIQTMHATGYAHCDIKIDNVVLKENSDGNIQAALTDFGFAKKIIPGTRCKADGTPVYIPPEKLTSDKWLTEYELPSDIWSLGILLYIIYTKCNTPLWCKETEANKRWDVLLEMAKSGDSFVTQEESDSRPELNLVRKMCQYNPKNRPTIDQVYQEFSEIQQRAACQQ